MSDGPTWVITRNNYKLYYKGAYISVNFKGKNAWFVGNQPNKYMYLKMDKLEYLRICIHRGSSISWVYLTLRPPSIRIQYTYTLACISLQYTFLTLSVCCIHIHIHFCTSAVYYIQVYIYMTQHWLHCYRKTYIFF